MFNLKPEYIMFGLTDLALIQYGGGGSIAILVVIAIIYFRITSKRLDVLETTMIAVRSEVAAINVLVAHLKDTRPSKDDLNATLGGMNEMIARIDERVGGLMSNGK